MTINWVARDTPDGYYSWYGICWSPELTLFVAVGSTLVGGSWIGAVMTSPNGIDWTLGSCPGSALLSSVCWSPELTLFVAVGPGASMTSPNGIDWTNRTVPDCLWHSVCWSPYLSKFAAAGSKVDTYRGTTYGTLMTSSNGTSWTEHPSPTYDFEDGSPLYNRWGGWYGICWSPYLSKFMVVGNKCNTWSGDPEEDDYKDKFTITSSDGTSWILGNPLPEIPYPPYGTTSVRALWSSVCWSPSLSKFVASATDLSTGVCNQNIMTSTNGVDWTTYRITGIARSFPSVAWSPALSRFVAVQGIVGASAVITSPDGTNWALHSVPIAVWDAICWSPDLSMFAAASGYYTTTSDEIMTGIGQTNPPNIVQMIVEMN